MSKLLSSDEQNPWKTTHVTGNCEIYFEPGWFSLLRYAQSKDADQISTHNEMCYEWYKLTG